MLFTIRIYATVSEWEAAVQSLSPKAVSARREMIEVNCCAVGASSGVQGLFCKSY